MSTIKFELKSTRDFIRFVSTNNYYFNLRMQDENNKVYAYYIDTFKFLWHFIYLPQENIVNVSIYTDNGDNKTKPVVFFGENAGFRKCPFESLDEYYAMQYVMLWTLYSASQEEYTDFFHYDRSYYWRDHKILIEFVQFYIQHQNDSYPFVIQEDKSVISYMLSLKRQNQTTIMKCVFRQIFNTVVIDILENDNMKQFTELYYHTNMGPQNWILDSITDENGINDVLIWTLFLANRQGYTLPKINDPTTFRQKVIKAIIEEGGVSPPP